MRFLYCRFLKDPKPLTVNGPLLHFAPESCHHKRLSSTLGDRYVTADLHRKDVTSNQDITNMTFPDHSFSTVICSHVLEHIPDDSRAIRELYRVTQPGGRVLIQVPLRLDAPTDEDPSITDPNERKRRWGERDHLRMYGLDLADRIHQEGFHVEVLACADLIDEPVRNRFGLYPDERTFVATRPQ
jgi:SAM-dependent methyltransferase